MHYIYKLYALLSLRQFIYNNKAIAIKKSIKKKEKKRETTTFIFIIYLVFAQR